MSRKTNKYHFNPNLPIWVRRTQPRVLERGIQFWQPGREQYAFWSCPSSSAQWLTGIANFDRHYSVVSFLAGLAAAGRKVVVFDNQHVGVGASLPGTNPHTIVPIFWLLGYLTSRNEQNLFRTWLWQFNIGRRVKICEIVARHFISNPGRGLESLPEIRVSIGVFF